MTLRNLWMKTALLLFVLIAAISYIAPTVLNLDLEKTRFPIKKKVNLGLDLQGGLYLVLGVDFQKFFASLIEKNAAQIDVLLKKQNFEGVTASVPAKQELPDDPRLNVKVDAVKKEAVRTLIKKDYPFLRLTADEADRLEFGFGDEYRSEIKQKTLSQSVEVIRNRVDEFGVAEPMIATQGSDRIVVELPGIRDVERAKELIGRTAKLEFRMVEDKAVPPAQLFEMVAQVEKEKNIQFREGKVRFSDYVLQINQELKAKIPAGMEISFEKASKNPERMEAAGTPNGDAGLFIPYLLKQGSEVTGDDLADASVAFDPDSRRPMVSFSLNPKGAQAFDQLTAANIGKRLAIVLDGVVHSAPVIQSRIGGGRGQITLGQGSGEDVVKEAQDLAIVLRAGALPAQLDFLQQRVIGPSLGQDSIANGIKAGLVGCIALFIFLSFYYKLSGVLASISLMMNGLFVFAILVAMDATLTLPGIAGIALTIGMAVDSNVLVFERIRDELREGKTVAAAIQGGFDKAFTAIFDSNLTHGIIALVLLNFGTGPIRGFAVALLIGIVTTLFCAVTVCRVAYDWALALNKGKLDRLSI